VNLWQAVQITDGFLAARPAILLQGQVVAPSDEYYYLFLHQTICHKLLLVSAENY